MNPAFLLDTNILSEPVKPSPDATLLDHLRRHSRELAISGTTRAFRGHGS